ncbi:uncharacterized protein LOC144098074 [Amblyomma americanum]
MAIVDSCYKYVLIDVSAEGRQSDGGVLKNSDFGKALVAGELGLPLGSQLPATGMIAPYAFVGDEAFQLRKDFMRPFPDKQLQDEKRIFNYRLSRARRCAENAFDITAARWRILLRTINLHPKNVDYVVKATCVLHNFILTLNFQVNGYADKEDNLGYVVQGRWRQSLESVPLDGPEPIYFPLESTHARNFPCEAADARNLFLAYFCSPSGKVPWQWSQPGVSKPTCRKRLRPYLRDSCVARGPPVAFCGRALFGGCPLDFACLRASDPGRSPFSEDRDDLLASVPEPQPAGPPPTATSSESTSLAGVTSSPSRCNQDSRSPTGVSGLDGAGPGPDRTTLPGDAADAGARLDLAFTAMPDFADVTKIQERLTAFLNSEKNKISVQARTNISHMFGEIVLRCAEYRALASDARSQAEVLRAKWSAERRE